MSATPGTRLVIKLGTSSLCDEVTKDFKLANMASIVEMTIALRRKGYEVCLVSSGGIAAGIQRMHFDGRPTETSEKQAVAAIGQARLIRLWDNLFGQFEQPIAQVLLTRTDIADHAKYRNASNTILSLLEMGCVPIVNENDALSTYGIRFGDNDTLSAITAAMISAEYLFLLTDVDCLYTGNPRTDPQARPVREVVNVSDYKTDESMAAGTSVGTGGMLTKITAAKLATSAGVTMYICRSFWQGNVMRILEDIEKDIPPHESEHLYTKFDAQPGIKDRQFWLLHGLAPSGSITIDKGCYKALTRPHRANLLPSGVIDVSGNFHESDCIEIRLKGVDLPVGRCLPNYGSIEINLIKGHHSHDIPIVLGYSDSDYIAFRENMAFFPDKPSVEELPTIGSLRLQETGDAEL